MNKHKPRTTMAVYFLFSIIAVYMWLNCNQNDLSSH